MFLRYEMDRRPESDKPRVPIPLPDIYYSIESHKNDLGPISSIPEKVNMCKRILKPEDVSSFLRSEAIHVILNLILKTNNVIKGFDCKRDSQIECIRIIISILEAVDKNIDNHPAEISDARFGSKTFRTFLDTLETAVEGSFKALSTDADILKELRFYFLNSFGNRTRIDYGSGHELNFIGFLACLYRIGTLNSDDSLRDCCLVVFDKYLRIVRRLQKSYRLEPAGSHGVWGLDDFQFVSYIFGSAQLIGHRIIKPKSVTNDDMVLGFSDKYIYMGCIKFLKEMKKGPFHEHSPMLFDISGVPSWEKVNLGLLKMYVKEVLEKYPIVQHFEFGTILRWKEID